MSMRIITGPQAIQGSPAWIAWRKLGIGASEAPIIMGKSHYSTPYGLYKVKTGKSPPQRVNPAMLRGIRLEPKARAAYESFTGNLMVPMVVESTKNPLFRASLDGLNLSQDLALEIKVPGVEAHRCALNGSVPSCFSDQVQHQMYVTGLDLIHYYSYDGESGILLEVKRDQNRIDMIVEAELAFWDKVQKQIWSTDEWAAAAEEWIAASHAAEYAADLEKEARNDLISLLKPKEAKREGSGVSVTRVPRKGSVDFEAILASKGIVLDEASLAPYRKKETETIQIRVLKEAKANPVVLKVKSGSRKALPAATQIPDGFILTV